MNPVISKQVNVNSPQYFLRNEKKNIRNLSPSYQQVKKQNTSMPTAAIQEQNELHQSVPTNLLEIQQKQKDLYELQEKMQETLSKSIDKAKVQNSSAIYSKGQPNLAGKSPIKNDNQIIRKKVNQDIAKSDQKNQGETKSRSKSNNASMNSNSFNKIHSQSFKSSNTPQILQNIYTHKRAVQNNPNSDSNIQEEANQTNHDVTLESFYREIEKNKEYLSNQRAYTSVSPMAIDRKLLSTLQKNNQKVLQIYSQVQNQMKRRGVSPNQQNKKQQIKPSPAKTDNRKVLYESYSQEKIQKILQGGQILDSINQEVVSNNNQIDSRKASPLFGGRNEENSANNRSSQNSSTLNQLKSQLTDSPIDQQFNTIPSIPSCLGTGQFVTLPNDCFNSINTSGNVHKEKVRNHHGASNINGQQSNLQFIGKYKPYSDSKGKTQITSLTKFMKKLNNEQYQGSSQLYQQLQKSQKIAQEQYRNMLISPSRKTQQFFGQNSAKESFITPTRKQSVPKDPTPEKAQQQKAISPSNRPFIVKGSKSNNETPKNQESNFQFSQHIEVNQNVNAQNIKQPKETQQKQNLKGPTNNLIIINNKKNQQINQAKQKDINYAVQNTSQQSNQVVEHIQQVQQSTIENGQIQQQIERLNEQNKIKDQQIEYLNHQVKYLIEQITRQSQLVNEEEHSLSNYNAQSFDYKSQDRQNSSRQQHQNELQSNYTSTQKHEEEFYSDRNNHNIFLNEQNKITLIQEASFRQSLNLQAQQQNEQQEQNQQITNLNQNQFQELIKQYYILNQKQTTDNVDHPVNQNDHYENQIQQYSQQNQEQQQQQQYSHSNVAVETRIHQKQLSFSAQEQANKEEEQEQEQEQNFQDESQYHQVEAQNQQAEYSYENQEIQSEPLNENSIQQLEKRCKTEDDYLDDNNTFNYNDSIHTNSNNIILTPKSIEPNYQQHNQDNNQIQQIQEKSQSQTSNQNQNEQKQEEQNQIGDIKILNNFQPRLSESSELKNSVKSVQNGNYNSEVNNLEENLVIQKSHSENHGKEDDHVVPYKTPHERSMQQPQYEQNIQNELQKEHPQQNQDQQI
ncbi:hypothetical protein TTHERM_00657560 (macronuclear) [Tetrahymena thermophila SB210]|uniref:Uncharacterized protein n=1 Tax=Tetrahymena thermophila (strain SB210) TaxID=312017 RepID=I7MA67_TETTS|nr:hypothetical protein TTHERM_00657560 [Tetrahymena thermophila SB210]EAS03811.1 hypothetical protein TTHERM_00657560 [Tetrahymena thermophila SB210]|eukprot:XP_001024056.1 hypothetical protein TTHERM_00657560 [Tetrahymena thermophila SB210]